MQGHADIRNRYFKCQQVNWLWYLANVLYHHFQTFLVWKMKPKLKSWVRIIRILQNWSLCVNRTCLKLILEIHQSTLLFEWQHVPMIRDPQSERCAAASGAPRGSPRPPGAGPRLAEKHTFNYRMNRATLSPSAPLPISGKGNSINSMHVRWRTAFSVSFFVRLFRMHPLEGISECHFIQWEDSIE